MSPLATRSILTQENPFQNAIEFQRFRPGVAYYGYRWYDPQTGRWPSRDPICELSFVVIFNFHKLIVDIFSEDEFFVVNDQEELYQMVKNSPVNNYDLFGLRAIGPLPTADCEVIAQSSSPQHERTECLNWNKTVQGGRIVKTTCSYWRCFFRCYCPNRKNCKDRPCIKPGCNSINDHGIEVRRDSTIKDRSIWAAIVSAGNAGAPRCNWMTGEAAKKVKCLGGGPKLK